MIAPSTSVLLIEDNPGDALLIREALSGRGMPRFSIDHARDLDEAGSLCEKKRYDAILLDLGLPGNEGFGTLLCTRDFAEGIPIIVLTGTEDEELEKNLFSAGAQDYIVKGAYDGQSLSKAILHSSERHSASLGMASEVERLRKELDDSKRKRADLERQLELEKLITVISSSFIVATGEQADFMIDTTLEIIGKYCDADRAYMVAISNTEGTMTSTNEWCAPAISPLKERVRSIALSDIPFTMSLLRNGKPVVIMDTHDLPPETENECGILLAGEKKAVIVVPTFTGAKLSGCMGIESLRTHKKWGGEDIMLLSVIGDIVCNFQRNVMSEGTLVRELGIIRGVIDHSPDAILIIGMDTTVIDCNQAALDLHGYSKKCDLVGRPATELVDDADIPRMMSEVGVLVSTGKPIRAEFTFRDSKGGAISVELSVGLVRNDSGQPVFFVGTAKDVTTRKNYIELLKNIERQHRAFLDNIPDPLWMKDRNGHYIAVNETFRKAFGVGRIEIAGRTAMDILPAGLALRQWKDEKEVMESGRKKTIEDPFVSDTGFESWIEVQTSPMFNDSGEICGTVGVARDITERRKMLDELRDAEERFYMISYMAADAVVLLDDERNVSFWNNAAEKIFGHDISAAIGRRFTDLLANERTEGDYREKFGRAPAEGKREGYFELPATRGDGREILAGFSISSIQIKHHSSLIVIARDVTEQRRLERELFEAKKAADIANRAKSDFLANMSHEIRTPMTSIIGMLNLLTDTRLDPGQLEFIKIIAESSKLLLGIINDILDLSKIEAGKLTLDSKPFMIADMINGTIEILSVKASEKNIEFSTVISPEVPPCLLGDPLRLQQVLINLMGNAVKFTSDGNIDISVDATKAEAGRVLLRTVIDDTGVGLGEDILGRLFEPFSQGDTSRNRKYGGTGLGLALSRRLIETMGGRIGAAPKPEGGSRFWFEVELDGADPQKASGTEFLRPPERKSGAAAGRSVKASGEKILVAEDNAFNQKLIMSHLSKAGFDVKCVSDGQAAFREAETGNYSLVVMDCQMPITDGYQATRLIRASAEEKVRGIPIVALTADAMEGARENCLSAGMNDYFTKPIDFDSLEDRIRELIDHGTQGAAAATTRNAQTASVDVRSATTHLDQSVLEKMRKLQIKGRQDIVSELCQIFLDDTPPKLSTIKNAIDASDPQALRAMAHNLKSACASIGALACSTICRELETFAKDEGFREGSKKTALRKFFELIKEYEILRELLSRYVTEKKTDRV